MHLRLLAVAGAAALVSAGCGAAPQAAPSAQPESSMDAACKPIVALYKQVVASEVKAIEQALRDNWGVSDAAAVFVTEVAIAETQEGLDYYQLIEGFKATTDEQERIQFLQALFAVAHADKSLFHEESEQIRRIARGLDLTREQFMTARGRSEG